MSEKISQLLCKLSTIPNTNDSICLFLFHLEKLETAVSEDNRRLSFNGLTSQRHSALVSSDSEYFQVCFSAVHYLKISEQRWKRKFSELKISGDFLWKSTDSELNSADFLWNSSDFWIIQNDIFWFFHVFQNFPTYLNFEAQNSGSHPRLGKEVSNNYLLPHFRTGQRYNTYLNFWVYCYCSNNKTDMVKLFKKKCVYTGEISRLFQEIWVFAVNLQNFYFFFNTGIPF